jgi:hypothetical protein
LFLAYPNNRKTQAQQNGEADMETIMHFLFAAYRRRPFLAYPNNRNTQAQQNGETDMETILHF